MRLAARDTDGWEIGREWDGMGEDVWEGQGMGGVEVAVLVVQSSPFRYDVQL